MTRINRLVYEECFGKIPEGMLACHKCDNHKCINPEHLFLGAPKDNSQDMVNKGRQNKGERRPNAKMTESQIKAIRKDGRIPKIIAEDYGMSKSTIRDIIKRKTWKHVE